MHQLRKQLASRRKSLSAEYREQAQRRIANSIGQLALISKARNIAAYIAIQEEVSLASVISSLCTQGKRVVLPCIDIPQAGSMIFADYQATLQTGKYGLQQPSPENSIDTGEIHVVLLPLLGFTSQCDRIGWGKGYYDKHFANVVSGSPWLIGIAFECQRDERITPQPWDVRLDMVITEQRQYSNPE